MDRKTREELKAISKEILGASSRWQKLTKGVLVDSEERSSNGRPIKTVSYMSPEEVLEHLRTLKKEREQTNLTDQVQSEAGGSAG